MKRTYITQLTLHHFRNYQTLSLLFEPQTVVLTGNNGAGKTNILEAISLLSPGKGLRNAALPELDYTPSYDTPSSFASTPPLPWQVIAHCTIGNSSHLIGTGRDPQGNKRIVRIDGEPTRGHVALSSLLSVVWVTPQMDLLFLSGSSVRRKFLDRMVYHFDVAHAERVASYEHAMRERARILKMPRADAAWLGVLEQRMAENAVAIAISRLETVGFLTQMMEQQPGIFPQAILSISGEVEEKIGHMAALQLEQWLRETLKENREKDRLTGRTNAGVHRSDLVVSHALKHRPAAECSTGEQKALLLSLLLSLVKAQSQWRQAVPLVLLDEVVAHLDDEKREALLTDLLALGAQCWLTGTDLDAFSLLQGKAQFFNVWQGTVSPC